MISYKLTVIFSFFVSNAQLQEFDLSQSLKDCLGRDESVNVCSKNVIEQFRPIMDTGISSLGLPALDPLTVDAISFKFFDATVEFNDVVLKGFQNMIVKYSKVDSVKRTWNIGIQLPEFNANGVYALYGTIPPNLDLERSSGDGRLTGSNVDLILTMDLGVRDAGKLEIKSFFMDLKLEDINAELECLFPRRGKCCPKKYLKSCNTILAKTVLRFINNDGKNFIKNFQPEITRQIGPVLKNYINM